MQAIRVSGMRAAISWSEAITCNRTASSGEIPRSEAACGLLFTPIAMVIAQTVLGTPIVLALVHRVMVTLWRAYGDSLMMSGASRVRAIRPLMRMGREGLLTAFLAAFGRAIAEVGAIIVVGGNIRGYTRTMTTTIALETSRGDLSLALALGIC